MIRKTETGQALVLTAAALVTLLGVLGLAIDMGVLRYDKRLQQTAADAAAIAGASNLQNYGTTAGPGVINGALTASAQNGFADPTGRPCSPPPTNLPLNAVDVTVCNPPIAGPHAGDAKYVEAYVSAGQPTYFAKVFGVATETVTARAVATEISGEPGRGAGCIYTTGLPTQKLTASSSGLGTSGSVVLNAPTCGIVDNGNFVANGGKQLSVTAASIGVGGVYDPPSGSATVSPDPTTGMPYSGDPLAGKYPTPTIGVSQGTIKITGGTCSGTGCAANVTCSGATCTIQPGTYDDICIDNNQRVDFSDGGSLSGGLFIITGASTCSNNVEFQINALATVCNSKNLDCSGMPGSANSGVTFYITGSASVNVDGTATVQLTAPNSGTYEGLLFYQDPSDVTTMTLSGDGTSLYQGAIYMANTSATLNFGGNTNFNSSAAYTVIDVGQLQLAGNPDVNINSDYSGLSNNGGPLAGAISTATLVE